MTANEIYVHSIKQLPAGERLRLATLILKDLQPDAMIDYQEEWSQEDLADFTRATWSAVDHTLTEAENAESR